MQPSSSSGGGGRKRTTKGRALGVPALPIQKRKKSQPQQSTSSNKRRQPLGLGCGGSNDEISPSEEVIWFYDENRPWGEFSNFYGKKQDRRFSLVIDGQEWKTTEHYFQAHKFLSPNASLECKEYAALVASQSTPNKAAVLARQRTGGGYKWRTDLNPIIQEYLDKGTSIHSSFLQRQPVSTILFFCLFLSCEC
ncbi:NADAR domain-containing protein (Fragment), variant 3 [Balamuthia mandrillaris]